MKTTGFRGIALGGLVAWVVCAGACSSDQSGLTGVAGTNGPSGRGGTGASGGDTGGIGATAGSGGAVAGSGGGGTAGTAGATAGSSGSGGGAGTGGRGGGGGTGGASGTVGTAGAGGGGGAAGTGGTGGGAPVDEVEPNDSIATANDFAAIAVGGRVSAAIAAGDSDYFSVTVAAETTALYVTTFSSGVDITCASANTTLSLISADGTTVLAINTDISSKQLCSHISYVPAPGTYFVKVNGNSSTSVFRYVLAVRAEILPAGRPETEPNDDGTPEIGNGMGSFEGNDFSVANSHGSFGADTVITAALTPVGDEDVFAIRNDGATPAEIYLETFNGGFGACADGLDTQIRIRDVTGVVLAFDDDASNGRFCSFLPYVIPPTTTVYAHVIDFGDNTTAAAYSLHISFP